MSEDQDLAESHGLVDKADSTPYRKIYRALESVADEDIDTGFGLDGADFWVTIDGREYFITARPSLKQIATEKH